MEIEAEWTQKLGPRRFAQLRDSPRAAEREHARRATVPERRLEAPDTVARHARIARSRSCRHEQLEASGREQRSSRSRFFAEADSVRRRRLRLGRASTAPTEDRHTPAHPTQCERVGVDSRQCSRSSKGGTSNWVLRALACVRESSSEQGRVGEPARVGEVPNQSYDGTSDRKSNRRGRCPRNPGRVCCAHGCGAGVIDVGARDAVCAQRRRAHRLPGLW